MGKKITDLPELTTPASGDWFEIIDASDTSESAEGTSKRVDYDNISIADASTTVKGKVELSTTAETETGTDATRAVTPDAYRDAFATTEAAIVHAATEKTTPADADELGLIDSATSYVLKKLTWANVKATLLTWLRLSTTIIPQNAPQGFLINGKISVTDAAGITVAIKTLAGTDPSATDPVYVRIGDTVRTISAALSVAKADGTNYCNAGSAELATKEVDWFVYLFWYSTHVSGAQVGIAFARYPGANKFSDFNAASENEKGVNYTYDGASAPAAGDNFEVIGRFAATLSAGAVYTWSVPTYTAANLIQRPIYETRFLDLAPVYSSGSGTHTTVTTQGAKYKISLDKLFIEFAATVTNKGTAAGNFIATLPFNAISMYQTLAGTETQIAGYALGVFVQSGTPYKIACVKYDQTTVWTNTHVPTISGVLKI